MNKMLSFLFSSLLLIAPGCRSASDGPAPQNSGQPGQIQSELIRITTDDDLVLHGILWKLRDTQPKVGIVLAQGTSDEFYSDPLVWIGESLAKDGYLTISLNRRDHGSSFGYHQLADAAMDHRYAVDLAASRGVRAVVLAGRSFGTVTAPYYVKSTDDPRIKAFILFAPVADYRVGTQGAVGGPKQYDALVATARRKVAEGLGRETFLIPPMPGGGRPSPSTYESFLDKRGPDSESVPAEILQKVGSRPILAIRDPADPLPGTLPPAQELLEKANLNLHYVLLPDIRDGEMAREAHEFKRREDEVLGIVLAWLKAQGLASE